MSRVIKRYENRKLYDTTDRKYVSLEDLAKLVRDGVDVQVIDMASDSDITTKTLTQVIFEEGKKGRNPLSKETLHDVIRWSNTVLDDGLKQVKHGIDQIVPGPLNRIFRNKQAEEVDQLKNRVASLEELITKLVHQTEEKNDLTEDTPAASEQQSSTN